MTMSGSMDVSAKEGEVSDKGSNNNLRELMNELYNLILEIIAAADEVNSGGDNNEAILGKILKAFQALSALGVLLKKQKHVDDFVFPDEFCCPISMELIKDPVVLSTGVTYDRPYIEKWLKDGNRICPQTQQVLSNFELFPNHLIRELIKQWCMSRGYEVPSPVQDIKVGSLTDADRKHISSLLQKLSSSLSDQKEAAKEIRKLTKQLPSSCSFFGESIGAMLQLLSPLTSPKTCEEHPDLHEDLITAVLNISIPDDNKQAIVKCASVIPLLIESLKLGTMETRTNAAAALFSLSALDDNKVAIGQLGALKPLLDLLEQGDRSAMKDAASAIYNLCRQRENRGPAVKDGALKVIIGKIKERVYVSEMLAILALLSASRTAIDELEKLNSLDCLLSIIRESDSETDKENCTVVLHDFCNYSRYARKDIREYKSKWNNSEDGRDWNFKGKKEG
ncbi:hypothetical protein BVRB_011510 [Beta vulgaris subsp. vulgaris]|uniref:RING-type E3 ubiquitin transferase n=1 Tax=Beta vulgaris subsp. vulgaris TaxID=3555 RepID=A0A0J8B2G4_BETVV|nr:hypothetical protein BVRB_011510 [Beta vulgaris subsp. vulgaris]